MHETPANFHVLERRLRLSGTLETRTALHIGSGGAGQEDAMDLPVLRDGLGLPFIPGSSLKGVIRSTVEGLLRAVGARDRGLWACDPLAAGRDYSDDVRACGWHATGDRSKVDLTKHCAACRLFGSHVLASHVRFSDALLVESPSRPPVEVRDGVAIDRDLRVVSGAQKYDFEVVSPGVRFDVEIFVENPEDWLLGLLFLGFDQLATGFSALGGFTSRGLGRVTLEWSEVETFTARQLFEGKDPEKIPRERLAAETKRWRDTLAARMKKGA